MSDCYITLRYMQEHKVGVQQLVVSEVDCVIARCHICMLLQQCNADTVVLDYEFL